MMYNSNALSFRSRLGGDRLLVGTFLKTPSGHATEILGGIGFDFVVIDAEHAPFDRGAIDQILVATRAANTVGVVRVPNAEKAAILSALDCGAAGILVPHVINADMARDVVAASRFRNGKRGFSNSTRAGGFGSVGMWDYVDQCDALTTVIAMIEDPEAVDCIDEIVAIEGLDAIFIGRGDLMVAYEAETPASKLLIDATEKVILAAKAAGVGVLTVSPGGKDTEWLRGLGVDGVIVATDQAFMRKAAMEALKALREIN